MPNNELQYQIALTQIPNVGDVIAKNLLAYCGSAKAVFETKKSHLLKIPGIGEYAANIVVNSKNVLVEAEKEVDFIIKNNIQPLFFTDENYPQRLKFCNDSPILLYYKGNTNLKWQQMQNRHSSSAITDRYNRKLGAYFIEVGEINFRIID